MDNIAVHLRISGVNVSDEDVISRRAAATNLATRWKKEKAPSKIVAKAEEIALSLAGDGYPSPSLGSEVESAIQKKSPSFLYEERPLDISICAGVAIVSMLDGSPGSYGWNILDVYAAALWSALAYQPVLDAERREKLRQEVLEASRDWSMQSAEKARGRTSVPDAPDVEIAIDENNSASSNFKAALAPTVDALRRNAALDREELDFLWWAQLGRSRLLNRPLSAITEPTRIVATGIEAAGMLRRLPCEVHREIVLRTLDEDLELDLPGVLAAIGEDRAKLREGFAEDQLALHPVIFPFLYALSTGDTEQPGSSVKRRVSEWGERALLEAAFARMMSQGVRGL